MKYPVSSDNLPFFSVKQRMKSLGASSYVLSRPEIAKLAKLLHEDEYIEAFIYGVYAAGWGMLVCTNRKMIFIDKSFLNYIVEESPYSMVSAIDHRFGYVFAEIDVHTRTKEYKFKRVNRRCAQEFNDFIESKMIQEELREMDRVKAAEEERVLQESINYHVPQTHVEHWVGN